MTITTQKNEEGQTTGVAFTPDGPAKVTAGAVLGGEALKAQGIIATSYGVDGYKDHLNGVGNASNFIKLFFNPKGDNQVDRVGDQGSDGLNDTGNSKAKSLIQKLQKENDSLKKVIKRKQ